MTDVDELAERVRKGIKAPRQSSSKWNELYGWLAEHFEIPGEAIRASLLAERGNVTNRIFKDNAWVNPQLLVLICVQNVPPEIADRGVDDFVSTFHHRLGVLPKLRVALIFDGDKLVKVKKLSAEPGSSDVDPDGASPTEEDQQ